MSTLTLIFIIYSTLSLRTRNSKGWAYTWKRATTAPTRMSNQGNMSLCVSLSSLVGFQDPSQVNCVVISVRHYEGTMVKTERLKRVLRRWTTHAWLTVAHTDNHVVHAYVIITTLCNHIEKRGTNKSIGVRKKPKTGADCYILRTGPN